MSDYSTRAREIVDSYFGSTFKGSNSTVDRCCIERFCEHVLSLSAPNPAPVAGDVETADKIMNDAREAGRTSKYLQIGSYNSAVHVEAVDRIVAALSAARADAVRSFVEAGLATEDGKPRKVLGTLPLTKDKFIIGDDCKVFYGGGVVHVGLFRSSNPGESDWHPFLPSKAWSTTEAALAARGGGE